MAIIQDIGIATAYGYAVSKGYEGTEEEFAEALANAGITLENITTAVDTFLNTTLPAATSAAVGEVTAEGTTQKNLVTSEGTTQVGLVTAEGTAQKNAVQDKGDEVIASIPQDYSDLSNDVDDLKNALNGLIYNINSQELWQSGGIAVASGGTSSSTTRIRTRTYIDKSVRYVGSMNGWQVGIFAYNRSDDSYVGMWNGSEFQTSGLSWLSGTIFIGDFQLVNDYAIRVVARTVNNDTIDSSYYGNVYLYHITDESLSMTGIPADALETNVRLNSIDSNTYFEDTFESDWKTGYIDTSPNVGNIVDLYVNTNTQYRYLIVDCVKGDLFTITAKGGSASRAWAFVNENNVVISHANANVEIIAQKFTATENGKLIVNGVITYSEGYSVSRVRYLESEVNAEAERNKTPFINDVIVPKAMPEYRTVISNLTYDRQADMPLNDLYAAYDELVSLYPNYVTKTTLGLDASGTYTIYRYDFIPELPIIERDSSNSPMMFAEYSADDFPVFIMDACIHGGEKPCAVALLNLMDKIARATDDNGILGWLRSNIHFVVVPMVNPWGYMNNLRYNSNHVDLNRNFTAYWSHGPSDATSDRYRGASALSEVEAQYINSILIEYKNKAVGYLSWHTFGSFKSFSRMTSFMAAIDYMANEMQTAGIDVIKSVTKSGWKNHNLPTESGLIGIMQLSSVAQYGMSSNQGAYLGIPSGSPECMYRFYDGQTGANYSTDVNCLNVEYMLYSVCAVLQQSLK